MYVLGAGILALAITLVDLLVNIHMPSRTGRAVRSSVGRLTRALATAQSGPFLGASNLPITQMLYGLVAALLLAAIVALSVKALRNRRLGARARARPARPRTMASTLQEAILGGQRALARA